MNFLISLRLPHVLEPRGDWWSLPSGVAMVVNEVVWMCWAEGPTHWKYSEILALVIIILIKIRYNFRGQM